MKKFIKDHKVIVCSLLGLVLVAGIGGTAFGIHAKKVANTQRALEIAASGEISEEDLEALEADGGFAEFGTEVVDPSTGETVVLTQDESGNIVRTVTKDSNGNNTGAVVPESHGGGDTPSPSPSPTPTPGHQHVWVAHQATRQIITGYTQEQGHNEPIYTRQGYDACSECGQELINCGFHRHNGHACSTYVAYRNVQTGTKYVVDVAGGQPIYATETYVDYYYCSDCGARQ